MTDFENPLLEDIKTGQTIEIFKSPFSIGRALECDYVIENQIVSRKHCILTKTEDGWTLTDSSTNGTMVNQKHMQNGDTCLLKLGDIINIGLHFKFVQKSRRPEQVVAKDLTENCFDDAEISDEMLSTAADQILKEQDRIDSRNDISTEQANSAESVPICELYIVHNPVSNMPQITKRTNSSNEQHSAIKLDSSSNEAPQNPVPTTLKSHLTTSDDVSVAASSQMNRNKKFKISPEHSYSKNPQSNPNSHMIKNQQKITGGVGVSVITLDQPGIIEKPEDSLIVVPDNSETIDLNGSVVEVQMHDGPQNAVVDLTKDSSMIILNDDAPANTANILTVDLEIEVKDERAPAGPKIHDSQQPGSSKTEETKDTNQFEELEDELMCTICANLFIKAVTLNCSHSFCEYCIGMWKNKKSDCPICRIPITSILRIRVLDNLIEKVMESASEETKQARKTAMEERAKLEQAVATKSDKGKQRATAVNRIQVPISVVTINDSDSDESWTDEYDDYDYDDLDYNGVPGVYYGGYGNCFKCGDRGHWANGCPFR